MDASALIAFIDRATRGRCPACGASLDEDRTFRHGDSTCPRCTALLWFFHTPSATWFWIRSRHDVLWTQHLIALVWSSRRDTAHDADSLFADHVARRIAAIAAEQRGVSEDEVRQGVNPLEDLAADSLDTVELIMEVEDELIALDDVVERRLIGRE